MKIRKTKYGFLATAFATAIVTASGCAGEDAKADPSAAGASAEATPAQESDIPDAILGKAAPPRGEDLAYLDSDPSTVGYIVTPDGAGPFPAVILIHEWNGLVAHQNVLRYRVRDVQDSVALDTTTYRRDAFINNLNAGLATLHQTGNYLRFGATVGVRQEAFYLIR